MEKKNDFQKDGDIKNLIERINVAIRQFTSGRAAMHVPPLDTDVDIVLADCEIALRGMLFSSIEGKKTPHPPEPPAPPKPRFY